MTVPAMKCLAAGLEPEDARDWLNGGCVVPHFRKIGEWTSAANINLAAAMEFTMCNGHSQDERRKTLARISIEDADLYESFKKLFLKQVAQSDQGCCYRQHCSPALRGNRAKTISLNVG